MNTILKLTRIGSLLILSAMVLAACGGGGSSSSNTEALGDSSLMNPEDSVTPATVDNGEDFLDDENFGTEEGDPLDGGNPDTVLQLNAGDSFNGSVQSGGARRFQVNNVKSILLISEQGSGNADLSIVDADMNEVCVSTSAEAVDICSGLVVGEVYFVDVVGVINTGFRIFALDNPELRGETLLSGGVTEGGAFIFFGSGFTAVNLTSLAGDADLRVVDMSNIALCRSENKENFDSCNNVDGSISQALDKDISYLVVVEGFTDSTFELQTLDADELRANVPVQRFLAANEQVNFFVRGGLPTRVTTLSGDIETRLFDASTNVLVCSPDDVQTGNCTTVSSMSLRIEVLGLVDSEFSLVAL